MDLDPFSGPTVLWLPDCLKSPRPGRTAPWTFTALNQTTSPLCTECVAIFQDSRTIDQNYSYLCHCFPYYNGDMISAPDASVRNCSLCSMLRLELLNQAAKVHETNKSPTFVQPGPVSHPEACEITIHRQDLGYEWMVWITLIHQGHKRAHIKLVGPFGMSSWTIADGLTNV